MRFDFFDKCVHVHGEVDTGGLHKSQPGTHSRIS
jgi:hypothetical protein